MIVWYWTRFIISLNSFFSDRCQFCTLLLDNKVNEVNWRLRQNWRNYRHGGAKVFLEILWQVKYNRQKDLDMERYEYLEEYNMNQSYRFLQVMNHISSAFSEPSGKITEIMDFLRFPLSVYRSNRHTYLYVYEEIFDRDLIFCLLPQM